MENEPIAIRRSAKPLPANDISRIFGEHVVAPEAHQIDADQAYADAIYSTLDEQLIIFSFGFLAGALFTVIAAYCVAFVRLG